MTSFTCFISLLVLITVHSSFVSGLNPEFDVLDKQFGGFSIPKARNISSFHGIADSFSGNGNPFDLSMFSEIFSDILEAPVVKIITSVYELYRAQTESKEIIFAVLSSAEMSQLIDNWLTRSDVTPNVITAVQSLVSSPELITVIDVLVYDNNTSTSEQLCTLHNFTKLPEFRQLFNIITSFAANTTLAANTTMSQLELAFRELTGIQDILNNRLPDVFNWDEDALVELVFSPVVDTFLDIYCELVRRFNLRDTDIDTTTQSGDDPPMAQAQALSDVADLTGLTGLSTDELLDQLQAALNVPDLAEIIGDINSTLNIDQIITQLQTSMTSGNLTELQQIFSQLQNGSLGNETVAVQEFISDLAQQVNDTWVIIQPIVGRFIENFIRETLTENGVSDSCQDSSFVFVQALLSGETWTLQYFDAMGKPPSDLLALRTNWLGSFDECTAITSSSIDGAEPFDGKYCRTTISIPELQAALGAGLTLGTCVPSTCSAGDTLGLLLTVQKLLLNGSTPIVPSISCVEDREFGTDAVIVTCLLVIIGFIVVCGTLYDVVSTQSKSNSTGRTDATSGIRDSLSSTTTSGSSSSSLPASLYKPIKTRLETSPGFINNVYSSGDDEMGKEPVKIPEEGITGKQIDALKTEDVTLNIQNTRDEKCAPDTHDSKGPLDRIMLSFSAYTNGVKVLNTEQPTGALTAINGIRFLSMAWVILGHTYYFANNFDDNLVTHYGGKINHWTFPVVMYATVSVDSFFTISGILVGYLTLRQLEKVGGARNMNWFLFYFHRFWRLTPSYMLILMTATVLLPYVATGPMWEEDFPGTQGCRKYWWTNLLYINNFVNIYPDTNMCMGWTWYLANDMHFYILSPLILLPLFYNVIAGIVSCVVFLAATITTTAILVHKYEYSAQSSNLLYAPIPKDGNYFQRVYIPSYTRMGPYIIGLFTGYMLFRLKSKCRIPKIVNLLCWVVCLAICCLIVYGPYSYEDDHIFTQLQSEVFHDLHRTGWGVAVSWIVFACATGNGGWINDLLSWRPFIPLGRLTYGAYLLHPLAIFLFYTSRRIPTYFTDYEVTYLFVGHVVLSYGAAFVTCLMFESPMMGLEKVIFGKNKK